MAYILEYINHEFNGSIRDGNFYDLGSGMGKGVVAMSLLCHFKKLIGIEFLDNLFNLSLKIKQNYEDSIEEKFKNSRNWNTYKNSKNEIKLAKRNNSYRGSERNNNNNNLDIIQYTKKKKKKSRTNTDKKSILKTNILQNEKMSGNCYGDIM